ncbi:unnamed protein product [Closterium sp. Naga37s-1]|nr:unnamed protein product [Closterium sp. Naga37s-1]
MALGFAVSFPGSTNAVRSFPCSPLSMTVQRTPPLYSVQAQEGGRLLLLPFTTLFQYLQVSRSSSTCSTWPFTSRLIASLSVLFLLASLSVLFLLASLSVLFLLASLSVLFLLASLSVLFLLASLSVLFLLASLSVLFLLASLSVLFLLASLSVLFLLASLSVLFLLASLSVLFLLASLSVLFLLASLSFLFLLVPPLPSCFASQALRTPCARYGMPYVLRTAATLPNPRYATRPWQVEHKIQSGAGPLDIHLARVPKMIPLTCCSHPTCTQLCPLLATMPPSPTSSRQVEHKIQSGAGPLDIHLARVPKMIPLLRSLWCPSALLVSFKVRLPPSHPPTLTPSQPHTRTPSPFYTLTPSQPHTLTTFKLETDSSILLSKARSALQKNHVHAVVANELLTRGSKVVLVTEEGEEVIERGEGGVEGKGAVGDVEEPLVKLLAAMHHKHCQRD